METKSYKDALEESFDKYNSEPIGHGSIRDVYTNGFNDGKSFSDKQHEAEITRLSYTCRDQRAEIEKWHKSVSDKRSEDDYIELRDFSDRQSKELAEIKKWVKVQAQMVSNQGIEIMELQEQLAIFESGAIQTNHYLAQESIIAKMEEALELYNSPGEYKNIVAEAAITALKEFREKK